MVACSSHLLTASSFTSSSWWWRDYYEGEGRTACAFFCPSFEKPPSMDKNLVHILFSFSCPCQSVNGHYAEWPSWWHQVGIKKQNAKKKKKDQWSSFNFFPLLLLPYLFFQVSLQDNVVTKLDVFFFLLTLGLVRATTHLISITEDARFDDDDEDPTVWVSFTAVLRLISARHY